ncbi:PLDc N-terminal domain-containing protein [Leifsonia sp. F6_8S_P_1B]|uniref:PLDc N-terminal domain-containing protein n=1 Tax=Leifsonia williamsii TaxID=3035919 RepID=A0ABT8K9Z1_9MICO|nr:PLDc N-terminal domain-containing protein [Leifsonia williamsii]MDN4613813.1 PLDc N-terminal domain-containing protein [Leifsonia williamsii]
MLAGLTGWHTIIMVVLLLPWLIAVVQIARSKAPATPVVLWLVVVTVLPLIGALLWFAVGRASLRREAQRLQGQ